MEKSGTTQNSEYPFHLLDVDLYNNNSGVIMGHMTPTSQGVLYL